MKLKKLGYLLLIPLIIISLLVLPTKSTHASNLARVYVTFSRMRANLGSAAELEIYIAFETSEHFAANGTLTMEFPNDSDGQWCRTAGTDLDIEGVASTPADSTGSYVVDAALPASGTLSAACSQGSGSGSVDKITITNVGALTAGNVYGVRIGNGSTGKIGTASSTGQHLLNLTMVQSTDLETKSFGINLVSNDQVVISAEVLDVQTVTCSLGSNTVDLGNLYKGGSYVTGGHTITVSTSTSAGGWYWAVYGQGNGTNAGLWKSTATTYLILSDAGETSMDLTTAGSEGFGMVTTTPGSSVAGAGFDATTNGAGVFGTLGQGSDNAKLLLYRIGAQGSAVSPNITYGARAGTEAEAGSYSETVTFVCGGYY